MPEGITGVRLWEKYPYVGSDPGRYASNPIINVGAVGSWKEWNVHTPVVFVDPTNAAKLIMVFSAVSSNPSAPGAGVSALGIAVADVSDPYHWTECAGNPFLLNVWTSGFALVGTTVYLYTGNPLTPFGIDRYTSTNLTAANALAGTVTFTRQAQVMAKAGDETLVYYPTIYRKDATHWYMAYTYDTATAHVPGIRMATSPDGLVWTSVQQDLISRGSAGSFDDNNLEGALLMVFDGIPTLTYNAFNGPDSPATQPNSEYNFGMAGAADIAGNWAKSLMNPVFRPSFVAGTPDRFHISTPWWLKLGTTWYLFYQGANGDPTTIPFTDNYWVMCMATAPAGFTPLQYLVDVGTPATLYTLIGPASGANGVASAPFTVELQKGRTGSVNVVLSDGGSGGTFTPSTPLALSTTAPKKTVTYTPASTGAKTISATNDGGLANPVAVPYSVAAGGLVDGGTVVNWLDSSPSGNHLTPLGLGTRIFKTNQVNGKPLVRLTACEGFNLTTPISAGGQWLLIVVCKKPTASLNLATLIGAGAGGPFTAYFASDGQCYWSDPSNVLYATATGITTGYHVWSTNNAGGGFGELCIDGTSMGRSTAAQGGIPNFTSFGGRVGGGSDGDIVEAIFCNALLMAREFPSQQASLAQNNLEKWLGIKYGITVAGPGVSQDPATQSAVVGWWKADSLL
jgi:hypothetical protein